MRVKNIIVLCDSATANGGACSVGLVSAKGLSLMGYNVIVFSAEGPIDPSLRESGVKVVCLEQKNILNEPNRLKAIVQGIWNKKAYDAFSDLLSDFTPKDTIVHVHVLVKSISPSVLRACTNKGFKVLFTLHDAFMYCPNGGLYNYQEKCICNIKPGSLECLLKSCDARRYVHKIWRDIRLMVQTKELKKIADLGFITISKLNCQLSKDNLSKYPAKWYHLDNPIELNVNNPVDINNNDLYLYLGRVSFEKGIDMFCKAISEMNLKGCVLGDGHLLDNYKSMYPNIEFAGWVSGSRKEEYIRKAKCLVFPSRCYENAPLSIIEIKSYGIPCVVPDRSAAAEEIEDGKTGVIFISGDVESLKSSLERYEMMDLKSLQYNILTTFDKSRYALESHCKKLLDIYEDIISH